MYAISVGPLTLSAYSLSVALAVGAGLTVLWWVCRQRGLDDGLAVDAVLGGLLLGVVAARAETILSALEYFLERPSLAFCLRQGGLGGRTLLAVLVITYAVVTIRSGLPWRAYLSALTPAIAVAAALLWLGSLLWGGFAGRLDAGWAATSLPDAYGIVAPRLPLQAAMALANALLAAWAIAGLERILPAGVSLAFWGASTSALAALLGNYRHEPAASVGLFPSAIVADAALALVWLAIGAFLYARAGRSPEPRADGGPGGA